MSWQACLEESTGDYYYWNEDTNEVTWEKPEGFEASEVCVYPASDPSAEETTPLPPIVEEIAPLEAKTPIQAVGELDRVDSVPLIPIPVVERNSTVDDGERASFTYDADDEYSADWMCPLDRDNDDKARMKYQVNEKARVKVQRWIEAVLDQDLGLDLGPAVQDGQVLCQFLNKIRPGTVKKIHDVQPEEDGAFVSAANIFKAQENVSAFTKGCIRLGVPRSSIFDTLDIIELRDLNAFLHCVTMLGRIVQTFKDYDGPQLLSRREQIEAMKFSFKLGKNNNGPHTKNIPSMFRRETSHSPPVA